MRAHRRPLLSKRPRQNCAAVCAFVGTAADGTHVCVLVDSESGKAVPLAAPFKRAMAKIDENPVKASL